MGGTQGAHVRLLSRNRLEQHHLHIAEAVANLPLPEIIRDGEITWDTTTLYHVFDVLWMDGRDVTMPPLKKRRELLGTLPLRSPLQRVVQLADEKSARAARAGRA